MDPLPTTQLDAADFPHGQDEAERRRVYGDPDQYLIGGDDRAWRGLILAPKVYFPAPVRLSGTKQLVSGVCVHRRLESNVRRVFQDLDRSGAWRYVTDFAGCYSFRLMRGGKRLSNHALAAALDFNAERYPLGAEADPDDPFVVEVVPVFLRHGWTWGGDWSRPDAMHFEACRYA